MKKILTLVLLTFISLMTFAQSELSVILKQETQLTARANVNELILKASVQYKGVDSVGLQSVKLNLNGTTSISDVDEVRVYSTGLKDYANGRFMETATLLGSCVPTEGDFECELDGSLLKGINYLWLTVNVAKDAAEGNFVDMSLLSVVTDNETFEMKNPSPTGSREIILARTTLLRPGDYNSSNYRIPAIITAKDGSIVAFTDKRKYNNTDLPEDIDIICNRSTDGGHTWSEPITIAQGTGRFQGYGDAALVHSKDENGLLAVFVGGQGLWTSTPSVPQNSYMVRSNDNGQTWTEPEVITHFIYGKDCTDPTRKNWYASFFGSGNGLLTSTGRIMFVAAIRESGNNNTLYNYVVYSDDNGETWNVSGRASVGGDEAKVTELADGRILMSIRHGGNRWYNISSDGGLTWQYNPSTWYDIAAPACNGDLIRYTSVNNGDDKNRLLHSVPTGTERKNVTIFVSYDEGQTWPTSRCIVPYSSAYSSLCILPDNTIGIYVEEDFYTGKDNYSTVFYNFSLEWLTKGADGFEDIVYEVAVTVNPENAGTVTGAGSFEKDETVTLVATANEGYKFVNWTENDEVVSEKSEYSFTITSDRELVANFVSTESVDEYSANTFNVFPSPASVNAEIKLGMTYDRVEVYNSVGAKIAEYTDIDKIEGIETAGVYVIKVVAGSDVRNCRIVVR